MIRSKYFNFAVVSSAAQYICSSCSFSLIFSFFLLIVTSPAACLARAAEDGPQTEVFVLDPIHHTSEHDMLYPSQLALLLCTEEYRVACEHEGGRIPFPTRAHVTEVQERIKFHYAQVRTDSVSAQSFEALIRPFL